MGPDLVDVLRRLGLHSLGDLAALPVASVVGRFGREGLVVHRLARGLDERPPATGEHLGIDVDLFDDHQAAAARAEADGAPSLALQHYIAAVDLHRGDLHADMPGAGWFLPEREHHRRRFVQTAVRAGQLLLGRGDAEHARALGHRALAVDQRSESAYAVLVGAALALGDRSAARRLIERCREALDELGASPSAATEQLARRLLVDA